MTSDRVKDNAWLGGAGYGAGPEAIERKGSWFAGE